MSWAHRLAGLPDPCVDSIVVNVKESAMRNRLVPVCKKDTVTPKLLFTLVEKFGREDSSLLDLRYLTMSLLSYAGFFRVSEVVNIKRNDLSFYEGYVRIFIRKSKTDVYPDRSVLISTTLD